MPLHSVHTRPSLLSRSPRRTFTRRTFTRRPSRALAVFVPLTLLLILLAAPAGPAAAFTTNGQSATIVLGQTNVTTSIPGAGATGMNGARGVVMDPASGKVFVADFTNNRVLRFASLEALASGAAAEAVLGQPNFSSTAPATTQSGMREPNGLAVDSAGRLWVAEYRNHRVLRFDNAATIASGANADGVLGQANYTNGTFATAQNRMRAPQAVAVDSNGVLWVADQENNRVLRFDNAAAKANGANADGVLGQPNFTSSAPVASQSTMSVPQGIAVDSSGRLWVAEYGSSRVLRFDNAAAKPNGANADGVLGQPNFTSIAPATSQNGMNQTTGVAADSSGRIWVADFGNNRLLRFDNAAAKPNGANADGVLGQAVFTTGAAATTATGLRNPYHVAIGLNDWPLVGDFGNHRVLYYGPLGPTPRVFLPLISQ